MWHLILLSLTHVTASVLGIDFGSELIKCSLIRPGKKLIIVENEQSKRSTPSAISFSDQGREYGYNALKSQPKRPEFTVLFVHNLLGSPDTSYFSRTYQPIPLSKNEARNSTLIQINKDSFETEEIAAMILQYVKEMSEKFGEGQIKDCSITIPSFWTRAQKIAVISAANAAGLNVLSLMHENTGAAFYYAIDRLDNVTEHFVLFYNLGASYLQVTLAKYGVANKKVAGKQIESVEILAHSHDQTLGGSLFDSLIAGLLAERFKEKHGFDLLAAPKSMVRVLTQANLAKKTLSANKNTVVILNSIYKGIDFSYTLTREEFEKLIEPYTERLVRPVFEVLSKAGIGLSQVNGLEVIGGVSRVPRVQEILKEKTGLEISTHLNGDESIAHGAAIYAANFSSVVQVKPLWLTDVIGSTFVAKFLSESDPEWKKEAVLFKEGTRLESKKKITFGYSKDLKVLIEEVRGENSVPLCSYEIKGVTDLEREDVSLFFSFVLDSSGIPFLQSTDAKYERMVKKKEGEESEGKPAEEEREDGSGERSEEGIEEKSEEKIESEEEKSVSGEEKAETGEEKTETGEEKGDAGEKNEKNEQKGESIEEKTETKGKGKAAKAKKHRTVSLKSEEVQIEQPSMLTNKEISNIVKRLESLKEAEVLAQKLTEAQNDIESSIYTLSEKLDDDSFHSVTSPSERADLSTSISKLRDWLESPQFKDSSAYEVKKRKKELESQFSDALQREKEKSVRDSAVEKAYKDLGRLEDALIKLNETKPWIPAEETLLAWSRLNETLKWIETKVEEQKNLQDWEPLAFRTSELEIKVAGIQKLVDKMKKMTKPKPKKGSAPDFMNFGDGFDWSKVKMENVKIDGKEYNYDPEKDGDGKKQEMGKEEL